MFHQNVTGNTVRCALLLDTAHEMVNKMESGKGVVKFYFLPSFLAIAAGFATVTAIASTADAL